jgi:3-mercaptopyruvate sulfurtransferase SseA
MSRGYARVRPLEGGLEAWIAAGGETETFEQPLPASAGETHA